MNEALLLELFIKLIHPHAPCALIKASKGGLVLAPLDYELHEVTAMAEMCGGAIVVQQDGTCNNNVQLQLPW